MYIAPILGFLMIIWLFRQIAKDDKKYRNYHTTSSASSQYRINSNVLFWNSLHIVLEAKKFSENGDYESAVLSLNRFFSYNEYQIQKSLDPEQIDFLITLYLLHANCLSKCNQHQKAVEIYTKIILYKNNNDSYFNLRGNCYSSLLNYDSALIDYTKAIQINPNERVYFYNRGLNYLNLAIAKNGNMQMYYDKALSDGNKALSMGFVDAQKNIISKVPVRKSFTEPAISWHPIISNQSNGDLNISNQFVQRISLCNYIPSINKTDTMTVELLNFKSGKSESINRWSNLSIAVLQRHEIKFDFIIRVLGSDEIYAEEEKPLDKLCRSIAKSLDIEYIPNLIYKSRRTSKLSHIKGLDNRIREISGAFGVNSGYDKLLNKRLLLIDDVLTAGTTSNEVIKSIKTKYSTFSATLFTLTKTSNDVNSNSIYNSNLFMSLNTLVKNEKPLYKSETKSNDILSNYPFEDDLPF
jgi:tetratricopeptide (TPR) repeat protein